MFVRWQEYKSRAQSRRLRAFRKKHGQRLRAILVETVRIDGKPLQRYLVVRCQQTIPVSVPDSRDLEALTTDASD